MNDLIVDQERYYSVNTPETGIYVRAKMQGTWNSYDIADLDAFSLLSWLRSRGGHNPWAENVVGQLLGHGPLTIGENDE